MLQKGETDLSNITVGFKAFGKNSDAIFEQLEVIRRQQLALAMEHIAPDGTEDMTYDPSENGDSADANKRNAEIFLKKQEKMKAVMEKLAELNASMKVFQELSKSSSPRTSVSQPTQSRAQSPQSASSSQYQPNVFSQSPLSSQSQSSNNRSPSIAMSRNQSVPLSQGSASTSTPGQSQNPISSSPSMPPLNLNTSTKSNLPISKVTSPTFMGVQKNSDSGKNSDKLPNIDTSVIRDNSKIGKQ